MLAVDRAVRRVGGSGFETQVLVWLSGRVEVARLCNALARLREMHPVTASRLVGEGEPPGPRWQFHAGAACPLRETDLDSAGSDRVLAHAAQLLSAADDPAETGPLRFHLLHRSGGGDVFLMQHNHALMDNNATVPLLREIDRLSGDGPTRVETGPADLARRYLRRFPRERRRKAARDVLRLWGRWLRGGVATLGRSVPVPRGAAPVRIATRCLTPSETGALTGQVAGDGGFPSLSMAVLGSAFRSIGRLIPGTGTHNFLAGIGVDLGLRGRNGPLFQNLVSLVPIGVRSEELEERAGLTRTLSRRLREALAGDADLGVLQLAVLAGRGARHEAPWVIEHLLRHGFSLWYGYFGALDVIGTHFCGTPVEKVFYAGPAWPPLGLTLLVNQFRGSVFFQATYLPESVPERLAGRFLDELVGGLAPD
jgi:hypothetical protein